jgi:hypothetical protein
MTHYADDLSPVANKRPARVPSGRIVTATAAATATGALACAVCCVLPFALPAVAMAAAGGVIAWLVWAQGWMMDLALIAVASGWIWIGWQSLRHRARPATSTLGAMGGATLLLALATVWPMIEPIVIELLRS